MENSALNHLSDLLNTRESEGLLRFLQDLTGMIDFCSNDYLGLSQHPALALAIEQEAQHRSENGKSLSHGATGSRLISGHSPIFDEFEQACANMHRAEAALLFASGYDANVGLIAALAQEGQVIFCDKLLHASLIDGLRLCKAEKRIFKHNDLGDLVKLLEQYPKETPKWIVVESIYSMDGDMAPLAELVALKNQYNVEIIVDEAHSGGLYGPEGSGLCVELGLEKEIIARVITFGKAWGNAGAVVLGSTILKDYLINFARPFIYSTAPSPQHVSSLLASLEFIKTQDSLRQKLQANIQFFQSQVQGKAWGKSQTAIQTFFVSGNQALRAAAKKAQEAGFAVKPIVYPTVAKGHERIRITLHAGSQEKDMLSLIQTLNEHA
jgi:8-amino-7-oxononanoate synthase